MPKQSKILSAPPSRREYFDANYQELYKFDHINVSTSDGGRTVRPSRYFDRLYDVIDPYDLSCKKDIWKDVAIHRNKVKLSKTSLDYESMLAVENVSHPEEILSAFFRVL